MVLYSQVGKLYETDMNGVRYVSKWNGMVEKGNEKEKHSKEFTRNGKHTERKT